MKKHATQTAAELKKLLGTIGSKSARKGDIVAWYRTDAGLALGVRLLGGVELIAGEPRTIDCVEAGLAPSRMARCGQIDALLGAGAEPIQAYQAADPDTGGELSPRQVAPRVAQLGLVAGGMLDGLAWCAKATATDAARIVLQSVHVQLVGGAARLVGADNYRLHIEGTEPIPAGDTRYTKAEHSVGVPRRLAQYLAARGESVRVDYHPAQEGKSNGATIRSLGLIVRIQADETRMPDFGSIIPTAGEMVGRARIVSSSAIEATKAAIQEAALADAMQGGRVSDVRILTLAVGAGGVIVAAKEPHKVASSYESPGGEAAAVNADYLLEALEGMGDEASLALAGSVRPFTIRSYDRTAVIMPIRAKEGETSERIEQLRDLVGQAHAVEATA